MKTRPISEAIKSFELKEAKNPVIKKVTSKAWAKKMKDKWHNMLTSANVLSKELTPRQVIDKVPKEITKDGMKRIYGAFINAMMDDVGANVGSQAWNQMTPDDVLKMVNNVASTWKLRGYGSIEGNKVPKSDGLKLVESVLEKKEKYGGKLDKETADILKDTFNKKYRKDKRVEVHPKPVKMGKGYGFEFDVMVIGDAGTPETAQVEQEVRKEIKQIIDKWEKDNPMNEGKSSLENVALRADMMEGDLKTLKSAKSKNYDDPIDREYIDGSVSNLLRGLGEIAKDLGNDKLSKLIGKASSEAMSLIGR